MPNVAIHTFPRLALYPAPPDTARNALTPIIQNRCSMLWQGRAADLWNAHPWLASLDTSPHLRTIPPEKLPDILNRTISTRAPSKALAALNAIPFIPPHPSLTPLLRDKVVSTPNPDLDPTGLPTMAAQLLPQQPHGSARIGDPAKLATVTQHWTRAIANHADTMPDGTGLRLTHFPPSVHQLLAQWLHAISQQRTTAAHRTFQAGKALGGQTKALDNGTYPTTAAEVEGVRPLSRHSHIRRIIARDIASPIAIAARPDMEHLSQYGLSRAASEATAQKMQIVRDTRPSWPHFALDCKNAYGTIARIAIARLLYHRYSATRTPLDLAALRYFLFHYAIPGTTIHQEGAQFISFAQTDGIDQGDGMGNYLFGFTYTAYLVPHLRLRFHTFILAILWDDTTLAAPTHEHPDTEHNPTAATTEPPYAIRIVHALTALLRPLRLELVLKKTKVLCPSLDPSDPTSPYAHRAHLPTGVTWTASHYRLAGTPVGTPTGRTDYLAALHAQYTTTVNTLVAIPGLIRHGLLIIIIRALSPSARFCLHLRTCPPTATMAFALDLRRTILTAIATIFHIPHPHLLDAPPEEGTAAQFLRTARAGGSGVPDPPALALTAPLAALADTANTLATDPHIGPLIRDDSQWPDSNCPTLADAHAVWHSHTASLPALQPDPNQRIQPHQKPTFHSIITDNHSLPPQLHLLLRTSGRHAQTHLHDAASRKAAKIALDLPTSPLAIHAKARHRAAAVFPAYAPLLAATIPPASMLRDSHITWYICHRFGIPQPDCTPASRTCHPKCNVMPPHRPLPTPHPLEATLKHIVHHLSCRAGGHNHRRHNAVTTVAATSLAQELQAECHISKHLASSTQNRNKIDALIIAWGHIPPLMAIDGTASCTLLPAYVAQAATDPLAIFLHQHTEKCKKHLEGCNLNQYQYLTMGMTTLCGVDPNFSDLWRSIFRTSASRERLATGTAHTTHTRMIHASEAFVATFIAFSADIAQTLSDPTRADDRIHHPTRRPN